MPPGNLNLTNSVLPPEFQLWYIGDRFRFFLCMLTCLCSRQEAKLVTLLSLFPRQFSPCLVPGGKELLPGYMKYEIEEENFLLCGFSLYFIYQSFCLSECLFVCLLVSSLVNNFYMHFNIFNRQLSSGVYL